MSVSVTEQRQSILEPSTVSKPRLGFLGVGWIGRHRMEAIVNSGLASVDAIVEPSVAMAEAALSVASDAELLETYDQLLDLDLDGVVIATPSAMHAEQAIAALEKGFSVFCQKPLARTAQETRLVVDAARAADRLLCVDLSYRFIPGVPMMSDSVTRGALGKVFAVDLVFHNAYGPDKPWFYDPRFSGGGCLMDLGVHLVDLATWVLKNISVRTISAQLLSDGNRLTNRDTQVEDFAAVQMELEDGTAVRLTCSWNLSAGREAVIEASFFGTDGGIALKNVKGSFFDFVVERYRGTSCEVLSSSAGNAERTEWDWGGQAALDWARRVSSGERYDPECGHLIDVAEIIDQIYGRPGVV